MCSAVGMLPLSIHYGYAVMQKFLEGAHDMDTHFFSAPFKQNIPVSILFHLINIWHGMSRKIDVRV